VDLRAWSSGGGWEIVREGALSREQVARALAHA
jgi:hypothetical protein